MANEVAPLILCMESASGEEIALQIEPDDSVETFLAKAKSILGFDVDVNSITNNQPISLTDNIYNYLINAEEVIAQDDQSQIIDQNDGTVEYLELIDEAHAQVDSNIEYEYIELQEEPKLPPVKTSYVPDVPFKLVPNEDVNFASQFSDFVAKKNKLAELVKSPPAKKAKSAKKVKREKSVTDDELSNFKDEQPMRVVFTKEEIVPEESELAEIVKSQKIAKKGGKKVKRQRSLSDEEWGASNVKETNIKAAYTREEILDILIDEPRPADLEKNKNKRKVNQKPASRCVCYVCDKYLEPAVRFYLFDKYDQEEMKLQNKRKQVNLCPNIVCEDCLNKDFDMHCKVIGEHQLSVDEYLIIKEKTQLIYKKRKKESTPDPSKQSSASEDDVKSLSSQPFMWRNTTRKENKIDSKSSLTSVSRNEAVPKTMTPSMIEKIVSQPVDPASAKPQVFFKTGSKDLVTDADRDKMQSKDTKIGSKNIFSMKKDIEMVMKDEENSSENKVKGEEVGMVYNDEDFGEVEYLDSTEDQVLSFMGKAQKSLIDELSSEKLDYVCRFCEISHSHLATAITHSLKHKHAGLYACTLCEDGYENFSMLREHMRMSHRTTPLTVPKPKVNLRRGTNRHVDTNTTSKNTPNQLEKKNPGRASKSKKELEDEMTEQELEALSSVLKQEMSDEDEGIWIVQTDDNDLDESIYNTIMESQIIKEEKNAESSHAKLRTNQCPSCRCHFATVGQLTSHTCQNSPMTENSESTETEVMSLKRGDLYHSDSILAEEEAMEMDEEWIADEEGLLPNQRKRRPRRCKVKKEVTSEATVVTCYYCDVSFTSKVRLKFHMSYYGGKCADAITAALQLACHVCAAGATTFRTEAELYDHVHFAHVKRRPFMCKVEGCQKEFYLRATLTKHMRTHTNTRRYRCQECGKRFLDKQTLDEHSVMHLDNKPYQCHICWKQLTRRSRLRMHLRAHEAEIRANLVLVCRVCDRAFRDHSAATEHSKTSSQCKGTLEQELSSPLCEEVDERMRRELMEKLATLCGKSIVPDAEIQIKLEPQVKRSNMENLLPVEADLRLRTLKLLFEPNSVSEDQAASMMDSIPEEQRALIKIVEIEKAFRCEYCEDVFYLEQSLNEHRHLHRGQVKPFKCHVCNVGFSSYSRCTTHKTTHGFYKKALGDAGDDEESWTGPSAAGIVGYEDFPVVKHFLCECCSRSYLHWTYLHVHRRMKHSTPSSVMRPCRDCDEKFPNSWSLAYHRRRQHNGRAVPRGSKGQERDNKPALCSECPMIFTSKNALHRHRRLQHSAGEPRTSTRGHGFLSCGVCARQYASKAGLEAHVRGHVPPAPFAPFACARCGKAFPLAAALMTHVKVVHARELQYHCGVCARRFCTRSSLAAHGKTHLEDKPYECPVCGHAFRTHSMCAEHVRIHTDERPFPCDVCGVAFRRSAAMRNHRLIHTGERAFPCLRCHKRFRIRSDLKTHMKIKHPGQILVLEVGGLNPNPEQVLEQLALNNIAPEKIVDISKISVARGGEALIAEGEEVLFGEGADIAWGGDMMKVIKGQAGANRRQGLAEADAMYRRGRSIARHPRNSTVQRNNLTTQADQRDPRNQDSQHILYAVDEHGNHIQIDSAQLEALCGAGAFDSSEYCVMVKDENDQGMEGEQVLLSENQQLMTDENGDLIQLVDEEGRLVMLEGGAVMDMEQVYQLQYQDTDTEYQHQEHKLTEENQRLQHETVTEQTHVGVTDGAHNVVVQNLEN